MKKVIAMTINEKVVEVRELTVRQMMELKESFAGKGTMEALQALLPLLTDASPDFLLDLAPSELKAIYEKAKEVNADFLEVLPLDKMLGGFKDLMQETIMKNLSVLSVQLLQPGTESQSMTMAGGGS